MAYESAIPMANAKIGRNVLKTLSNEPLVEINTKNIGFPSNMAKHAACRKSGMSVHNSPEKAEILQLLHRI